MGGETVVTFSEEGQRKDFFQKIFILNYAGVGGVCALEFSAHGGQWRQIPLELELPVVVSCKCWELNLGPQVQYGHLAAELCLQSVSKILKRISLLAKDSPRVTSK